MSVGLVKASVRWLLPGPPRTPQRSSGLPSQDPNLDSDGEELLENSKSNTGVNQVNQENRWSIVVLTRQSLRIECDLNRLGGIVRYALDLEAIAQRYSELCRSLAPGGPLARVELSPCRQPAFTGTCGRAASATFMYAACEPWSRSKWVAFWRMPRATQLVHADTQLMQLFDQTTESLSHLSSIRGMPQA
jgi:hypothetical protein